MLTSPNMEPKIYIGKRSDDFFEFIVKDYDILIFLPEDHKGNTDQLMREARNKFIELSDRSKFEAIKVSRPTPIREVTEGTIRQKRKRIIR